MTHLRQRLAEDLASTHERLDGLVSLFDLETKSGVTSFILMHEAALKQLSDAKLSDATAQMVTDLLHRAQADLSTLQVAQLTLAKTKTENLHPLAVTYVISGSRLGAEVLKKRWLGSEAAKDRHGEAYMLAPRHIDVWQSFVKEASDMPATSEVADQIVEDAATVFALYSDIANLAREGTIQYV